ncbi:energy-coupling factor transporter transmembrane protein EcfT [Carnobacteriaceae bacterium zg-ZUI240]|nr:energy-coupling factor transporter transmembrane protein EcfT [Carnobacteriaceae bacterium zg-ZUI240]
MNKFFLGRYIHFNSLIHHLDARLKIVVTLFLLVMTMIVSSQLGMSLLAILFVGLIYLSKVPLKALYYGLKPILNIILFTTFLQICVVQGGKIYFSLGVVHITSSGLNNALSTLFRLTSIVVVSTLLTLTTKPIELADAIEFFMWPLRKIINVPLWSLMFSVSIRFIPTLMLELEKIMMAQRSRGVRFESGGMIQRGKAFVPILLPLMVSTYKRAIDLGTAMTARGFNENVRRTKFRQLTWQKKDTIGVLISCLVMIGILFVQ